MPHNALRPIVCAASKEAGDICPIKTTKIEMTRYRARKGDWSSKKSCRRELANSRITIKLY